jgi:PAS domain S-box-containing protein
MLDLVDSEGWSEALLLALPWAVMALDLEGNLRVANPALCRLTGFESAELIGTRAPFLFWPPEAVADNAAALAAVVDPETPSGRSSVRLWRRSGERFTAAIRWEALTSHAGTLGGWLVTMEDVSAQERVERSLRESEAKLRAVFENSRDAIGVAAHGQILYVNPAYVHLLGYGSPSEMVGLSILDVVAPEDRALLAHRRIRRAQGTQEPDLYEFRGLRRDGTRVDIENHVSTYSLDGTLYTLVIARDVTARKRMESALRDSERLLRLIIDGSPILIAYLGRDERFRVHNQTSADWFGPMAVDLRGRTEEEVFGTRAYNDLGPYRCVALAGRAAPFERRAHFIEGGGRYLKGTYLPDRAADGSVNGYVIVATDITASKSQEHRQRFLSEVSQTLTSSLDYETILGSLAAAAVPAFADICAVDIVAADGELKRHAIHHIDEGRIDALEPYLRPFPVRPSAPVGSSWVFTHGQLQWTSELPDDPDTAFELLAALDTRSYLGIPLLVRGTCIGVLNFYMAESGRQFLASDTEIGEDLARRTALAVDNSWLYRAAQEEIGQRRQAQAEIEALNARLRRAMTETHHRVKNNLQLIAAMIDLHNLDPHASLPASEFQRLGRQVRTLAAVHDLLTEQTKVDGDASTVSARAVLEKLLPMLRQMAFGRGLHFDLDDAPLTGRQGTSLVLVVNEICANAIKHGTGDIRIELRVQDRVATVTVCDSGPGFRDGFDPERERHTGLDLVQNLTAWDLQGQVTFENRPEGGCVSVRFPITVATGEPKVEGE